MARDGSLLGGNSLPGRRAGIDSRYAVWGVLPLVLLIGIQAAEVGRSRRLMIGAMAMSILCGIAIGNRRYVAAYQNPPLHRIAAIIAAEHSPDVPVVVISGYMRPSWNTTLVALSIPPQRCGCLETRQPRWQMGVLQATIGRWQADQRFWLLLSREYHEDPQGELTVWLAAVRRGSRKSFAYRVLFSTRESGRTADVLRCAELEHDIDPGTAGQLPPPPRSGGRLAGRSARPALPTLEVVQFLSRL